MVWSVKFTCYKQNNPIGQILTCFVLGGVFLFQIIEWLLSSVIIFFRVFWLFSHIFLHLTPKCIASSIPLPLTVLFCVNFRRCYHRVDDLVLWLLQSYTCPLPQNSLNFRWRGCVVIILIGCGYLNLSCTV